MGTPIYFQPHICETDGCVRERTVFTVQSLLYVLYDTRTPFLQSTIGYTRGFAYYLFIQL